MCTAGARRPLEADARDVGPQGHEMPDAGTPVAAGSRRLSAYVAQSSTLLSSKPHHAAHAASDEALDSGGSKVLVVLAVRDFGQRDTSALQ